MKTGKAIEVLVQALKTDKEYREVWNANIAVQFKDSYSSYKKRTGKQSLNSGDIHIISNNAAESFIKLLCDEIKVPKGR